VGASLTEFAASADLVTDSFKSTLTSVTDLSAKDVLKSVVVLSVVAGIVALTIIGLVIFAPLDYEESKKAQKEKLRPKMKTIEKYLNEITPLEFRKAHWQTRLWRKLLVDHDWLCVLSPFNPESDYRTVKWMHAMCFLLITLFVDTFLAIYTFSTNGTCITFTDEESCLYFKNLDQMTTLCSWDSSERLCSDNQEAQTDPFNVVLQSCITTIITIPLMIIMATIIAEVRNVCVYHSTLNSPVKAASMRTTTEIEGMQTMTGTMLRAARLVKLQRLMDDLSVDEEAREILEYRKQHSCMPEDVLRLARAMGAQEHEQRHSGWRRIFDRRVGHFVPVEGESMSTIMKRIKSARTDCDRIVEVLNDMTSDEERSQYL
jgi:hypothetical protein